MSDSYQAIYDAVRSRISGGNIADAVADVARSSFDISYAVTGVVQDIAYHAAIVRDQMVRPSVIYRPALSLDGDQWCALYGANLQEGLAGFGDSPAAAMAAFDAAWGSGLQTSGSSHG